jgi:hypothetical protein
LLGKVRLVRLRDLGDWHEPAADGEHLYHRWSGPRSLTGAQFHREDHSDSLRWHGRLIAGSVGADRLLFVRDIRARAVFGLTMTPVVVDAGTGPPT